MLKYQQIYVKNNKSGDSGMNLNASFVVMVLAATLGWVNNARAQSWGDIGTVSETTAGYLCAFDPDADGDNNIDCNNLMPYISTSGNVGIGTAAPANSLTVAGDISATSLNAAQLCDEDGANCQDLSVGAAATASGVAGAVQFSDGSGLSSDASNLFWDDTNNYLGIGLKNPTTALYVSKTLAGDDAQLRITNGLGANLSIGITGSDANQNAFVKTNSSEDLFFQIGQAANSTTPPVAFKSTGEVGIGTKDPSKTLHIVSTAPALMLTDSDISADFYINADSGVGGASIGADNGNDIAGSYLSLNLDGSAALMITEDRNVGIGTTAPANSLTVAGDISATSLNAAQLCDETGANCQDLSTGAAATASGVSGSIQLSNGSSIVNDASNLFWDGTNKRLGIGTNAPDNTFHVVGQSVLEDTAPFMFFMETDSNADENYTIGVNHGIFRINTVDDAYIGDTAFSITPEGNVGIGTTAPANSLTVVGDISATSLNAATLCDEDGGNCMDLSSGVINGTSNIVPSWPDAIMCADDSTSPPIQKVLYLGVGPNSGNRYYYYFPGSTDTIYFNSNGTFGAGGAFSTYDCVEGSWDVSDFYTNNRAYNFIGGGNIWTANGDGSTFYNGGNVGIGTPSPGKLLHLSGDSSSLNVGVRLHETTGNNYWDNNIDSSGNLRFYSNGAEKMRISSAGNVGIGTNSPSNLLTVRSDQDANTAAVIANYLAGTNARAALTFRADAAGMDMYMGSSTYTSSYGGVSAADAAVFRTWSSTAPSSFIIGNGAAVPIHFLTDDTVAMTIDGSQNVGIGTSNPQDVLDVVGTRWIIGNSRADATNKYWRPALYNYNNADGTFVPFFAYSTATTNGLVVGGGTTLGNAATRLAFHTAEDQSTVAGATRMLINSSGDVGIGTDTPTERLDVSGSMVVSNVSGPIITFNNTENVATEPDILFTTSGLIAAESSLIFNIDSLNADTGASFSIRHDSNNSSGERLFIVREDGHVGIGTESPDNTLHVVGTTAYGVNAPIRVETGNGEGTIGISSGGHLYLTSDGGEVYARDSGGNNTLLSPHRFDLIPDGPSEPMAWAFYSTNDSQETAINVDMLKVVRLVESLSGEKLVYEAKGEGPAEATASEDNTSVYALLQELKAENDALRARIEALEQQ